MIFEDGDYFGERALLDAMPEAESARTMSPCVFLTLSRGEYLELRRRAQD
jgi:CRP-like cAMP-binding protein